MQIEHIRLRALTDSTTFGLDVPLNSGLNVLRADNTSGKSTCLMAVVYCLGLERSLGPHIDTPLSYAMTQRIQTQKDDGPYEEVSQSYAVVQISNNNGDVLCVRRDVKGGADRKLVQTWLGATIDETATRGEKQDFFLHDPGAAVSELGFHSFLAKFLGLELPSVPKFNGSDCPLYLETLWPLFFVEQKRGWSAIQGPLPTFLGIQDLSRRVMEFVLQLDIGEARRRYSELRGEIAQIEQRWRDKRRDIVDSNRSLVRVAGLPQTPTIEFSQKPEVGVSVYFEERWISVDDIVLESKRRREQIEATELKDAESAQPELQRKLREMEERESELSAINTMLRQEHQVIVSERGSLDRRIKVMETDLRRNLDTQKLHSLGSTVMLVVTEKNCPTCHQSLDQELLPDETFPVMAVDENIAFIRSQLDMYRSIKEVNEANSQEMGTKFESIRSELIDVRNSIRAIKDDLVRPSSTLAWSEIEEIVRLESRADQLAILQEEIDSAVDEFQNLAKMWTELTSELKQIRTEEMSTLDRNKKNHFQNSIQRFLESFGFRSFSPQEIELANDDYRLHAVRDVDGEERIEKNLGFEASASDGIRLKWAYYLALYGVAQRYPTNHLGIVMFDEPGQQQMKDVDFTAFLIQAAETVSDQGQIIVSTSEAIGHVRDSLRDSQVTIRDFDGFMIRPVS